MAPGKIIQSRPLPPYDALLLLRNPDAQSGVWATRHPFHEYLLAAMDDPDEEVLRAAMESLERQRVRTICSALRQRAMESTTTTDQWLYLDHLVEQVDPGLLGSDWPDDFNNLCADLSPLVWKRLWKRLEERRKKLVDALKK